MLDSLIGQLDAAIQAIPDDKDAGFANAMSNVDGISRSIRAFSKRGITLEQQERLGSLYDGIMQRLDAFSTSSKPAGRVYQNIAQLKSNLSPTL